jgi:predicted nucleic acid-binding protein
MKRIFFDTNVILDQLDPTRKGHAAIVELEQKMNDFSAQPLCAWHSLSIIEYVARKAFSKEDLYQVLLGIVENFTIPATGSQQAQEAFGYFHHDFEDALQIASAIEGKADYIVSNDKYGFSKSPITVVTPEQCAKILELKPATDL